MKYTVSMIAMAAALLVATADIACARNGVETYSGTGQTGGFVEKTGFVKERGDEDDKMGQEPNQDKDAAAKDNIDNDQDQDTDDTKEEK